MKSVASWQWLARLPCPFYEDEEDALVLAEQDLPPILQPAQPPEQDPDSTGQGLTCYRTRLSWATTQGTWSHPRWAGLVSLE